MSNNNRNRKIPLYVFLCEEEKMILEIKAHEAGMTKSEFVRNMILYGSAHKQTNFTEQYANDMIMEMNRIGNNLNQVVARINTRNDIDESAIDDIRQTFIELYETIERFVKE